MKAISLWQPWALAWLLQPDEKVFETRPRYWGHRGPLLVHAAKKRDEDVADALDDPLILEALWERHGIRPADLYFGGIIGMINVIGCSSMSRMPAPSERESLWGNWSPERFALERGPNPAIFKKPIPFRGQQILFDVPDELITEVDTLI